MISSLFTENRICFRQLCRGLQGYRIDLYYNNPGTFESLVCQCSGNRSALEDCFNNHNRIDYFGNSRDDNAQYECAKAGISNSDFVRSEDDRIRRANGEFPRFHEEWDD